MGCSSTTLALRNFDRFTTACETQSANDPNNSGFFLIIQPLLQKIKDVLASTEIRLSHPRDITQVHEVIVDITKKVCKIDRMNNRESEIGRLWLNTLLDLHHKPVYRIGHGPALLDCSFAIKLTKSKKPLQVTFEELPRNLASHNEVAENMASMEESVFGTYLPAAFFKSLLSSYQDTRCVVAKDEDGQIAGYVWGMKLFAEGKWIFHSFALARKVEMAKLGLAAKLAEEGLGIIGRDPEIDAITLNVEADNKKALALYNKLGFKSSLTDEQINTSPIGEKIFMVKSTKGGQTNSQLPISSKSANSAMRRYIVQLCGIWNLILFEIVRRITMLWKKILYSL